jgi:hypothetical protein
MAFMTPVGGVAAEAGVACISSAIAIPAKQANRIAKNKFFIKASSNFSQDQRNWKWFILSMWENELK